MNTIKLFLNNAFLIFNSCFMTSWSSRNGHRVKEQTLFTELQRELLRNSVLWRDSPRSYSPSAKLEMKSALVPSPSCNWRKDQSNRDVLYLHCGNEKQWGKGCRRQWWQGRRGVAEGWSSPYPCRGDDVACWSAPDTSSCGTSSYRTVTADPKSFTGRSLYDWQNTTSRYGLNCTCDKIIVTSLYD